MSQKGSTLTDAALVLTEVPAATSAMLIRRPVSEVFAAFVDPAITSKFWFTRGSGPLEPGATVDWFWDMYGFSTQASVVAVNQHRRILVDWLVDDAVLPIEWRFFPRPDGTTFVSIKHTGFTGEPQAMVQEAIRSTEGFTLVLAGLKGLLEHEVSLNLVSDRFPDGLGNLNPNPGA